MVKEPSVKKKKNKRLVSILVRSAIDIKDCEEVIKNCLKTLDLSKFVVVLDFERANNLRVIGDTYSTLVIVTGDSEGGWQQSGMKNLWDCLETTGYLIQAVYSNHSFIPEKLLAD